MTRTQEQRIASRLGVTIFQPGSRYSVEGWGVEYCEQDWWCDCPKIHGCSHIRAVIAAEGLIAFEEEGQIAI